MSEITAPSGTCPNCSSVVPPGSLFCPLCGKQQKSTSMASSATQPMQGNNFDLPAYSDPPAAPMAQPSYVPPAVTPSYPAQAVRRPAAASTGKNRFIALWIGMIVLRVVAWIVMAGGWLSILAAIVASFTGSVILSNQFGIPREFAGLSGFGWLLLIPALLLPPITAFPFFALADYLDLFLSIEANQRAQIALMSQINTR
jgi:hypothetical protein